MNNPLAFPMTGFETRYGQGIQSVHHTGMTLRDYFAAKAMQGFAACEYDFPSEEFVAIAAYKYADAMLKARTE
jgi:hypothetical protein